MLFRTIRRKDIVIDLKEERDENVMEDKKSKFDYGESTKISKEAPEK